jgi:RsiW-degrading membrane proteinase PrsW (M82 family)
MSNTETILYALLGGILPALLWLFFWLREDSKRPEPKGRLAETFLAGMVAVLLVLPFQKIVATAYPVLGFMPFLLWAILEELFKYGAAYFTALRTRDDDEPLDPVIYMITAALGFVALENALFIWNPLLEQNVPAALSTGGLRFLGASLLHVVASGAVGIALGLSFYFKSKMKKFAYALAGIFVSIVFHTAFNLFILRSAGISTIQTFVFVWIGAGALLLAFERIKRIAPSRSQDIINA